MKPAWIVVLLLLLPILQAGETIRLRGSDTFGAKLVPQWTEAYRAAHPETKFEIAAEGSASAFAALLDASGDIGISSRDITAGEMQQFEGKAIAIERHIVACDAWAIVVNAVNPVTNLTRKQVENLFTGEITNWKDAGGSDDPVSVFTFNPSSATYRDFQTLALSGRPYVSSMIHSEPLETEIAKASGGIACVRLEASKAPAIRVLRIEGKAPIAADLATYPYLRPCYLFVRKDAPQSIRDFVEWACSEKGKEIARSMGFLTAP